MPLTETPTRPSQTAPEPRFAPQTSPPHRPLFDLLFQLEASLQNPHENDLAPTQRAINRAVLLLVETQSHLPDSGDMYRDGDGGIRVEWESRTRQIRLFIHASEEREDYVYWQDGNEYSIDTPVTASALAKWQEWLQGSAK